MPVPSWRHHVLGSGGSQDLGSQLTAGVKPDNPPMELSKLSSAVWPGPMAYPVAACAWAMTAQPIGGVAIRLLEVARPPILCQSHGRPGPGVSNGTPGPP